VATESPDSDSLLGHLRSAQELAETAAANIIGGTGEARLCELGVLNALIALCLLEQRRQEREREAREKRDAVLDETLAIFRGASCLR